METHMKFRDAIAKAISTLTGEETLINDLSIKRVIDVLIPVVEQAASKGYDVGRMHQVNGGLKSDFMCTYFPKKEDNISYLP